MNASSPPRTPEQLIDRYCSAWSETDAGKRFAILDEVWADGATYTDPKVHVTGARDLSDSIGLVQQHHPGVRYGRISTVDTHHRRLARFAWRKTGADGQTVQQGVDFVEIDDSGRILRIVGFFDPLQPRQD